jgi:large subunit ribosomal protein L9
MKVILNQTVPKVGKEGQIVTVAGGFARNYLFPRNLAIYADRGQLRAYESRMARLAAKDAGTIDSATSLKGKLDGLTVKIEGKVGKETGKLFGAVTSQDVTDAIKTQLGVEIEKKRVALVQPIKRLGKHSVHIDLHREVDAFVTVHVFDPSIPEEPEAPVEAAPAEAAEVAAEVPIEKPAKKTKAVAVPEPEVEEPAETIEA